MSSEFIADAAERIVIISRALGVSTEVAGQMASQWKEGVISDWGGERVYVGKSDEAQRASSRRREAVLKDWEAGERVPAISRKHNISLRTVWRIVSKV